MSRLKWMAVFSTIYCTFGIKKSYYFVSNVKKSSVEFNFKTGKLLKWYVVKNSKVYTISICHMPSLKETSKPHYNSLKEEENSRIKFFSLSHFLGDLFFLQLWIENDDGNPHLFPFPYCILRLYTIHQRERKYYPKLYFYYFNARRQDDLLLKQRLKSLVDAFFLSQYQCIMKIIKKHCVQTLFCTILS